MIKAMMRTDVELLGTSLKLKKGQIVTLTPATNLPKEMGVKWYASDPKWKHDGSILVSPSDVTLRR